MFVLVLCNNNFLKCNKIVSAAKSGYEKIQYMLPVVCDNNAKVTCKNSTTKVTLLIIKPKIRQHHFKQLYIYNVVYPSKQVFSTDLLYL